MFDRLHHVMFAINFKRKWNEKWDKAAENVFEALKGEN